MPSVQYYFDEIKIKNPQDFEKELKDMLETLYAVDGWILSALLPKGSSGEYIIICHRLT